MKDNVLDIIFPAYNVSDTMMKRHIEVWNDPAIRDKIRIVAVDDCSAVHFSIDAMCKVKMARVTEDIKWHGEGAINLCFYLAADRWCVLLNADHVVPVSDILKIIDMTKTRKNIYVFDRRLPSGASRRKNVCGVSLIHRADWLDIGGYDEDFCGAHGCADWLALGCVFSGNSAHNNPSVASKLGYKHVQTDIQVIEYKDSNCGLNPDCSRNKRIYNEKVAQLVAGTYTNKSFLDFKWELVRDDV